MMNLDKNQDDDQTIYLIKAGDIFQSIQIDQKYQ